MVIPGEVKKLLDGPNFAHLATLMPDGSPQSVPGVDRSRGGADCCLHWRRLVKG
jgi:hypothetical protein